VIGVPSADGYVVVKRRFNNRARTIVIGRRRLFPLSDCEVWIKNRLFERIR
jgi:hypothetical protein